MGPKRGWHTSKSVFAPLAALYAVLLAASWDPSTLSLILPGSLKEGLSGKLLASDIVNLGCRLSLAISEWSWLSQKSPSDGSIGEAICHDAGSLTYQEPCAKPCSDERLLAAALPAGGLKPQFLPQISGIQQLFSRHITAASLMVHLSCINLFAARSMLIKGDGHCGLYGILQSAAGSVFLDTQCDSCKHLGYQLSGEAHRNLNVMIVS